MLQLCMKPGVVNGYAARKSARATSSPQEIGEERELLPTKCRLVRVIELDRYSVPRAEQRNGPTVDGHS